MDNLRVEYYDVFEYYLWWIIIFREEHGIANGIFNVLGGGDFGNGFAAGATASGLGSFAQGVKMRPGMMVLTTSVAGGVAAWATGGNFLKGALQGLTIGFFNHGMHYEIDAEGQIVYHVDLPEFVYLVNLEEISQTEKIVGAAAWLTTIGEQFGKSMKKNGGNSTFGNNGHVYFHSENSRGFYGNQYVRTVKLTDIGNTIKKYSGRIGGVATIYNIGSGAYSDYQLYQAQGHTNMHYSARAVGGWAGSAACAKIGLEVGSLIGGCFGGIGAVPGAIIGGAVFGALGAFYGNQIGEYTVDYIYDIFD